jgi:adenosylmethionine-8-amino-7-oxononanoate aminotransferase
MTAPESSKKSKRPDHEYALWHGALGLEGRRFARPDMPLVEGKGVRVKDAAGNWYLDSRSSLRTVTLGYNHPRVVRAIHEQLDMLPYAEIVRHDRPSLVAIKYADALVEALPESYTRIRFTTSGSRMVEEAIVLARFANVSGKNDTTRTHVITNLGSWHGLGGIASAATGDPVLHEWAGPLNEGFHYAPPNDIRAFEACLTEVGPERVCAVMLEPINGVGAIVLEPEYMKTVAAACRHNEIFLIADEVTTGAGRAGYLTYVDSLGISPDILVLGKGLTSGYVPISALAITEDLYGQALRAWPRVLPHSSTNDGHPLAMAAGLAVLEVLREPEFLSRVREEGQRLATKLQSLSKRFDIIERATGTGLIHFLDMTTAIGPWERPSMMRLASNCESNGLLIDYVFNHVIFTPPLVSTSAEIDEMLDIFEHSIQEIKAESE